MYALIEPRRPALISLLGNALKSCACYEPQINGHDPYGQQHALEPYGHTASGSDCSELGPWAVARDGSIQGSQLG